MQRPKARLCAICRRPMWDAAGCISSLLPQVSSLLSWRRTTAELLLCLPWDMGTQAGPNIGCSLSPFLQQSRRYRSAYPSSFSMANPAPPLLPIILHLALKPSCAYGSALPQTPINPGGSWSFPLGCWGTLADAHHGGLDREGQASHAAPIAHSTPSHVGSHGKPRAAPSLGISHHAASSMASPSPCHRQQSCRRGTAARPGAAFTFLPRAHLSAELSAAPVIGPRRSLVLGVNTAESEKTRAEPSPGASSKAAKYQRTLGRMPSLPPASPAPPTANPEKPPRKDALQR